MSNPERAPVETVCLATATNMVEVLEPRDVPLGGLRAMNVRRTLPQRRRSLIGAWCFLDHYGPDPVAETGGMNVPVHPHTGLQTVSWLFSGEIEHRDSAGHHAYVRPGELNLMTAGRGISHSERSSPGTTVLHGAQLWVALPERARFVARRFDRYTPDVISGTGWSAQVFLGGLLGVTAPVATYSPLVGAELNLEGGAVLDLPVDPAHEHGILADAGAVRVQETLIPRDHLGYVPTGTATITLTAGPEPVRLLVLGGEPFGEQIVMWWNFAGRTHDDIVRARAAWQAEVAATEPAADAQFGLPSGDPEPPLPAPELPQTRMKPRA